MNGTAPASHETMTTTAKLSTESRVSTASEGVMDRLVWAAWRAFWVGLGASAVLIGQSVIVHAPAPSAADVVVPAVQQLDASPSAKPSFDAPRISTMKARARHAS